MAQLGITKYIDQSWVYPLREALKVFTDTIVPALREEEKRLAVKSKRLLPSEHQVLRVFKETPYEEVRVVILGTAPYPQKELPTGLAFDTPKGMTSAPLRVLMHWIKQDTEDFCGQRNTLSYLEHLPAQGVLLLNCSLTVPEDEKVGHIEIWKEFNRLVLESLQKRNDIVWLLLGKKAQSFSPKITNKTHIIVEGDSPTPFTFLQSQHQKHFTHINSLIKGKQITW